MHLQHSVSTAQEDEEGGRVEHGVGREPEEERACEGDVQVGAGVRVREQDEERRASDGREQRNPPAGSGPDTELILGAGGELILDVRVELILEVGVELILDVRVELILEVGVEADACLSASVSVSLYL